MPQKQRPPRRNPSDNRLRAQYPHISSALIPGRGAPDCLFYHSQPADTCPIEMTGLVLRCFWILRKVCWRRGVSGYCAMSAGTTFADRPLPGGLVGLAQCSVFLGGRLCFFSPFLVPWFTIPMFTTGVFLQKNMLTWVFMWACLSDCVRYKDLI